jgi:HEAT repeat protein
VRLLEGFVKSGERKLRDGAVAGIAMHDDPAADAVLESYVAADQPEDLRRAAAFWFGVQRGRRGYDVLARMLREDPSDRVREHVVFALSRSKVPEALPLVLQTIRSDRSVRVRKQAMFWLAQSKDPRAIGFIDELLGK